MTAALHRLLGRRWCGAWLLGLAAGGLAAAPAARIAQTVNRDWTFQYFPAAQPDLAPAAPGYDDARWPAVALPHTWSTYETTRDLHPFIRSASERDDSYWWYGWGWYRKHFTVGPEYADRRVTVEFDGVQKYARVYLNGVFVGEHKGGYTSFSIDVTPQVHFGQDNVLAVQVSNRRDDPFGGIPPMTAGNFDVYGGIYRDVRLVLTDRLYVPFQGSAAHEGGTFVTTPQVSAEQATAAVRSWVQNDFPTPRECTLVTTIRDADGQTVAQASTGATIAPGALHPFDQTFGPIAHPHLWSPDTPYLYQVLTEVRDGDHVADTYRSPLGFRWFHWNFADNRLVLNGREILLRGTNRHQEFPWLGDAIPKWMHEKDLDVIRHRMGLYFMRTVHYPNDPFTYGLTDRLGVILIEESPNIKDIAFGRDIQKEDLVEAIRRDRNHPSIFIWSMGNETNQPADSAWAAAEDPTRIIYERRAENGGKFIQLTDKNLAIENLLRCTIRGWLDADDHNFGAETDHPDSGQVAGSEEWQYEKTLTSRHLLTGNVVTWLYADHGADRHYLDAPLLHVNPKGWVDAYRFPKLAYYIWVANYTRAPMAFIHPTYWRPQYLGQRHDIIVDSNCDEVELSCDGVSLGRAEPSDVNRHSVVFKNVEVRRGTLTVEGRQGDRPITAALTMAGPPTRLVLTAAPARIPADRSGIAVVSADIVDAAGVHVYGANPTLTWTVTGPARLVGPAVYTSDTAKNGAMEGTMYIDAPVSNVIRSETATGPIRVQVSAPGIESAEVTVEAVAPADESVPGLVEPALSDAGREPVRRDPDFQTVIFKTPSRKIADIPHDYDFKASSRDEYRDQVEQFVRTRNPNLDPFSAEFRAFVERITAIVAERHGHLVADDYNFDAHALNAQQAAKKGAP